MENVGEQSDCKRKMKFEAMELEVLVKEVNKHITELQQRNLNISTRNAILEVIREKFNKTRKTADKVRRRWQDISRRIKEKIAHNKTSANKTRGGKEPPHSY